MEDEGLWNEIDLIVNENEEASSSHSSSSLRKHVKRSLQVITDAIRLYGVAALAISFNGGKDATISLHLLRYALYQQNLLHHLSRSIPLIYFHDPQTFPEMELFLNETKEKYQLEYLTFHCSYKEGMKHLVEDRGIRAVIMGVRKGDPYSEEAEHLTPSSSNWPAFMRIYPLLNWKFSHVWSFIRTCHIPYCSLYDAGYTSIGLKHNTHRHESLRVFSPSCSEHSLTDYLPAYHLSDGDDERVSRTENPPFNATPNTISSPALPPSPSLYLIVLYDTIAAKDRLILLLNRQLQMTERTLPMVLLHAFPTETADLQLHLHTAQQTLSSSGGGRGEILIYGEFSKNFQAMCSAVLSSIALVFQAIEPTEKERDQGVETAGDPQELSSRQEQPQGLDWLEGSHRNVTYLLLPSPLDSSTSSRIETKLSSYFENRPCLSLTPSFTPPLPAATGSG